MLQAVSNFAFENAFGGADSRSSVYVARGLAHSTGGLAILVNTLIASRNTGVTAAIATGTDVAHGMSRKPLFVTLAPQDATPSGYFADTITDTTFRINYTGGGSHAFGFSAET